MRFKRQINLTPRDTFLKDVFNLFLYITGKCTQIRQNYKIFFFGNSVTNGFLTKHFVQNVFNAGVDEIGRITIHQENLFKFYDFQMEKCITRTNGKVSKQKCR